LECGKGKACTELGTCKTRATPQSPPPQAEHKSSKTPYYCIHFNCENAAVKSALELLEASAKSGKGQLADLAKRLREKNSLFVEAIVVYAGLLVISMLPSDSEAQRYTRGACFFVAIAVWAVQPPREITSTAAIHWALCQLFNCKTSYVDAISRAVELAVLASLFFFASVKAAQRRPGQHDRPTVRGASQVVLARVAVLLAAYLLVSDTHHLCAALAADRALLGHDVTLPAVLVLVCLAGHALLVRVALGWDRRVSREGGYLSLVSCYFGGAGASQPEGPLSLWSRCFGGARS